MSNYKFTSTLRIHLLIVYSLDDCRPSVARGKSREAKKQTLMRSITGLGFSYVVIRRHSCVIILKLDKVFDLTQAVTIYSTCYIITSLKKLHCFGSRIIIITVLSILVTISDPSRCSCWVSIANNNTMVLVNLVLASIQKVHTACLVLTY